MSAAPPFAHDWGAVLVMNGATGVGRAIALTFARHGARLILSGKSGRADQAALEQRLTEIGAPVPFFIDADENHGGVSALFAAINARCGPIHALIGSGRPASTGTRIREIEDYDEGEFVAALRAATWPLVEYTLAAKQHLGAYPRYVVALISEFSDRFTPGHDFAACAEATTETLIRYLAYRLQDKETRVNAIRSRAIRANGESVRGGGELDQATTSVQDVANAALALCSGMFDGMNGQVLTVDRGDCFVDGISIVYETETLG